jgi:hypothetical protein
MTSHKMIISQTTIDFIYESFSEELTLFLYQRRITGISYNMLLAIYAILYELVCNIFFLLNQTLNYQNRSYPIVKMVRRDSRHEHTRCLASYVKTI